MSTPLSAKSINEPTNIHIAENVMYNFGNHTSVRPQNDQRTENDENAENNVIIIFIHSQGTTSAFSASPVVVFIYSMHYATLQTKRISSLTKSQHDSQKVSLQIRRGRDFRHGFETHR